MATTQPIVSALRSWSPVKTWPPKDRISLDQAYEAVKSIEIAGPARGWFARRKTWTTQTGTRRSPINEQDVLLTWKLYESRFLYPETLESSDWNRLLSTAYLVGTLSSISIRFQSGIFRRRLSGLTEEEKFQKAWGAMYELFLMLDDAVYRNRGNLLILMGIDIDSAGSNTRFPATTDVEMQDVGTAMAALDDAESRQPPARAPDQAMITRMLAVACTKLCGSTSPSAEEKLHDKIVSMLSPIFDGEEAMQPPQASLPSAIWNTGPKLRPSCAKLGLDFTEHQASYWLRDMRPGFGAYWYQVCGINHVRTSLLDTGRCTIADPPGFGKTIQTLAGLFEALKCVEAPSTPASLVVVPNSITGCQWIHEGLAMTNRFRFYAVGKGYRSLQSKANVRLFQPGQTDATLLTELLNAEGNAFTIVVMTLATLQHRTTRQPLALSEAEPASSSTTAAGSLAAFPARFQCVVVDEVQKIRKSKESKHYAMITAIKAPWRVAVSATPNPNNANDILGLLGFMTTDELEDRATQHLKTQRDLSPYDHPHLYGLTASPQIWQTYMASQDPKTQGKGLAVLAAHATKWMLCRSKHYSDSAGTETIGARLKPDFRTNIDVEFATDAEKQAFQTRYNKLIDRVWVDQPSGRRSLDLSVLTRLASLSLTPAIDEYLLNCDADAVARMNTKGTSLAELTARYVKDLNFETFETDADSCLGPWLGLKLAWMIAFIAMAVYERREKVSLFVFDNKETLLVRAVLEHFNVKVATLHAGLTINKRSELVSRFNSSDTDAPVVFLSSWPMGSLAFNLQKQCRITLALSQPFNWDTFVQGHSRVYRIGQERPTQAVLVTQTPSFDTFFLLAHADNKRIPDLTALVTRIIGEGDEAVIGKLLAFIGHSASTAADFHEKVGDAVTSGESDILIADQDVRLLQGLLNGDMRPYIKDLAALGD